MYMDGIFHSGLKLIRCYERLAVATGSSAELASSVLAEELISGWE